MTLQPGTRLGPYEVLSALGAGGMGEVYRARDTKLGRDVAIKVLPEIFANDAERLVRLTREAHTLASLNHPNIAAIYGIEESKDVRALVMELVEGEDLSAHIARGPVPLAEALSIAKQVAEALEAAHERGIIHRDLKPANIKIKADGRVKVLDFGLAKIGSGRSGGTDGAGVENLTNSPTLTVGTTQEGVILGTAAYMAPEQARGRVVDKRADIWAFGVVLYELITGRRLFHGNDVSEILAAVIKEEPRWEGVPPRVQRLLKGCLEKDPANRLRDIGDVWRLLEETPVGAGGAQNRWLALGAIVTTLIAAALAPVAYVHFREQPPPAAEPMRFQIAPPEKTALAFAGGFAVSPDGRKLVFTAAGPDNMMQLWVRALDSIEARPLASTESGIGTAPFWSPDSRFVAFDAGGKLKKIDVSGGPAQTLCAAPTPLAGGSWNHDGVIIFALNGGVVMRVSAAGGDASPLTKLDPSRQELTHLFPVFLPDGRHFVYLRSSGTPEKSGAYVGSLDAKPEEQRSTRVMATVFETAYAPSSGSGPGWLLFRRDGTLMAHPFDDRTLILSGEPVPVAEQLGSFLAVGYFSISLNGVLVYRSDAAAAENRFLLKVPLPQNSRAPFTVVLNWQAGLKH